MADLSMQGEGTNLCQENKGKIEFSECEETPHPESLLFPYPIPSERQSLRPFLPDDL